MHKIVTEAKLFLESLDKKIDSKLLLRHVNMYLIGLLSVINQGRDDRLMTIENAKQLKAAVVLAVNEFKEGVENA